MNKTIVEEDPETKVSFRYPPNRCENDAQLSEWILGEAKEKVRNLHIRECFIGTIKSIGPVLEQANAKVFIKAIPGKNRQRRVLDPIFNIMQPTTSLFPSA